MFYALWLRKDLFEPHALFINALAIGTYGLVTTDSGKLIQPYDDYTQINLLMEYLFQK